MQTKRILIALSFLSLILTSHPVGAIVTQPTRGFGMGVVHTDSSEVITYISRESPLHDYDVEVGDEIVEVNGASVAGNDLLALGDELAGVESVSVRIRRPATNTVFNATLTKVKEYHQIAKSVGMLDHERAYIRLSEFTSENVGELEHALDSLAIGSDGTSRDVDVMNDRQQEALAYLSAQNPKRYSAGKEDREQNRADMLNYIEQKYGWHMGSIVLDLHSSGNAFSHDALRAIRVFCHDHQLPLVREI